MNALFYEVERFAARAREHVRRRKFPAHVAAEAVQNALIALWKGLSDPEFPRPRDPKAWLFHRSMMQAYALCRMDTRAAPLDDDAPATYDDLVQAGLADPGRYDPERPLVDAAESERVQNFCASLPPSTRETIEAEMQRQDEGTLASDAFRQRLRRARERARPHTRRFGLQSGRRSR